MPTIIGKNKNRVFRFVVDKVAKRLDGWKTKLLPKAGKDDLIWMVAQTVPNYLMSLFLLPLDVCHKIENMINSFYWASQDQHGALDGRAKPVYIILRSKGVWVQENT